MGTLNGTTPATTYPSLIKFDNNSAISAALRLLSDGNGGATPIYLSSTQMNIGGTGLIDARLGVKGTGTTSATTTIKIQNSAGVDRFVVQDNGTISVWGGSMSWNVLGPVCYELKSVNGGSRLNIDGGAFDIYDGSNILSGRYAPTHTGIVKPTAIGQITAPNASAMLDLISTTKGFLPPRMTNAEILLIATPAAGLIVYNTTNSVPCFYDGTSWKRLNHSAM